MIDFQTICEIPDTGTPFIGMSDNDNFMTTVDELCGQLVDVAFDSSWLREEEVADHSNVVRHLG